MSFKGSVHLFHKKKKKEDDFSSFGLEHFSGRETNDEHGCNSLVSSFFLFQHNNTEPSSQRKCFFYQLGQEDLNKPTAQPHF